MIHEWCIIYKWWNKGHHKINYGCNRITEIVLICFVSLPHKFLLLVVLFISKQFLKQSKYIIIETADGCLQYYPAWQLLRKEGDHHSYIDSIEAYTQMYNTNLLKCNSIKRKMDKNNYSVYLSYKIESSVQLLTSKVCTNRLCWKHFCALHDRSPEKLYRHMTEFIWMCWEL